MRRVAITGIGSICALGKDSTEFAESLRAGRCGISPIESADTTLVRFQNGAEVKGYTHQPYFDDRRADFMDRFAQFAVIALANLYELAIGISPMLDGSGSVAVSLILLVIMALQAVYAAKMRQRGLLE